MSGFLTSIGYPPSALGSSAWALTAGASAVSLHVALLSNAAFAPAPPLGEFDQRLHDKAQKLPLLRRALEKCALLSFVSARGKGE